MKNLILFVVAAAIPMGMAPAAFADIQAPPGSKQNAFNKLARSIANIVYGITEVPVTLTRTNIEGGNAVFSHGLVEGTKKSFVRLGFGAYEFVTFPFKTYKDSYRPAYDKHLWYDTLHGYAEFPPEVGFQSKFNYVRNQKY